MKKLYLLLFLCIIFGNAVSAQSLTAIKVTDGVALLATTVPGFSSTQYTYTVEYGFDYARTPIIEATAADDGSAVKSITQPGGLASATSTTGTIIVEKAGEADVTYTINFVKSDDYIDGCLLANGTTHAGPVIAKTGLGLGTGTADNHGLYIGHGGFRNNSASDLVYKTPALSNGAGTLSFYWKKYSVTTGTEIETYFHVIKAPNGSATPDTIWTVKVSDLDNVPDDWTKVEVPVNLSSEFTRVGFCTTGRPSSGTNRRYFIFDDIRITPYDIASSLNQSNVVSETTGVYAYDKFIVLEAENESAYQIYTLSGTLVKSGIVSAKEFVQINMPGIYLVKLNGIPNKVVVK